MSRIEAATYLGISVPSLDRMVASGEIKSVWLRGRRLFRPTDLDEALERATVGGPPPPARRRGVVRSRKSPG